MSKIKYTNYKDALTNAMTELGKKEDTIFIGQQIVWHGNPMSSTLINVSKEKMIEVPVMEESQMGISLGLAMTGKFVITFYPRWDFLISATNQLINNVDKLEAMSGGEWKPNIIIRIGKGSTKPLDPGFQHKGDYLEGFSKMLKYSKIYDLKDSNDIEKIYEEAYKNGGVNLIVEYPELYYS
jgi:pyruvate/2-oxoglutarate/acetoin dehydrogenase E1 component